MFEWIQWGFIAGACAGALVATLCGVGAWRVATARRGPMQRLAKRQHDVEQEFNQLALLIQTRMSQPVTPSPSADTLPPREQFEEQVNIGSLSEGAPLPLSILQQLDPRLGQSRME